MATRRLTCMQSQQDMRPALLLVALLLLTAPQPAIAQPPRPTRMARVPMCQDSTSTRFQRRLRVDLEYAGGNAREMWDAVEWAASDAAICVVSRDALPPPDTSVYGHLQMNALAAGGYEVATALRGPRAPSRPPAGCQSARAAIITADRPVFWGVILAGVVRRFTSCALAVRDSAAAVPGSSK